MQVLGLNMEQVNDFLDSCDWIGYERSELATVTGNFVLVMSLWERVTHTSLTHTKHPFSASSVSLWQENLMIGLRLYIRASLVSFTGLRTNLTKMTIQEKSRRMSSASTSPPWPSLQVRHSTWSPCDMLLQTVMPMKKPEISVQTQCLKPVCTWFTYFSVYFTVYFAGFTWKVETQFLDAGVS